MLLYANRYRGADAAAFLAAVERLAAKWGLNPDWLMGVFWVESKLNPAAVNPYNGASGLIQWTRTTAAELGTTVEQLRATSGANQIIWVDKYLTLWKSRGKTARSFYELYMVVHYPAFTARPANTVLYRSGSTAYEGNKALDANADGMVTIAEINAWLDRNVPELSGAAGTKAPATAPSNYLTIAAVFVVSLALYFGLRYGTKKRTGRSPAIA